MSTIDSAIKFLKGELHLTEEEKEVLLKKLYNYRTTQFLFYLNARLACGVGDKEAGWLLINSHFIKQGEHVVFRGQDYVITDLICEQYKMKNGEIQLEYITSTALN